ncbi:hypothetical protein [Staphylococcus epidermidis]|nr:hypothetical protein [Staphylococcus epidermidis]
MDDIENDGEVKRSEGGIGGFIERYEELGEDEVEIISIDVW